ncbi:MAG TPA: copper chaperone PCu(A)C [Woeseiaceae bacterium]|nr:copper chaperone PCu(A)C [Woeseiaceae bacterium]
MKALSILTFTACLAGFAPRDADAHGYKLGTIAVGHIWAPPPEANAQGLPVYGPIFNQAGTSVRLVGASTPIAQRVQFRRMSDGKATWPETIELPPGKPIALAPWREHIWLSGLRQSIKNGDSFDLTLDFDEAGKLTVKVHVQEAAGH